MKEILNRTLDSAHKKDHVSDKKSQNKKSVKEVMKEIQMEGSEGSESENARSSECLSVNKSRNLEGSPSPPQNTQKSQETL